MVYVDHGAKEINFKLVYHGPGLGGKTNNLQYVYNKTRPEVKSRFISLATETMRKLFFSFMPLSLGDIDGLKIRFHLQTVPGPVFYDVSRRLILQRVDGVVFVADSQKERFDANIESLEILESHLAVLGYKPESVPLVMQYNKRDLANAMPVPALEEALNPGGLPAFEAVAMTGAGVFETLKSMGEAVLARYRQGLARIDPDLEDPMLEPATEPSAAEPVEPPAPQRRHRRWRR